MTADTNPQRIAKIIAAAGVCSRRDAERLIGQGRVAVNGKTLDTPATLVTAADRIEVDGVVIGQTPTRTRLWVYHKPAGLVVSHRDEQGRDTVFDHLPANFPRVVSVGRLDLSSEGLLLLTTDGGFARQLELPDNALERVYRVRVRGVPSDKHLYMLSNGLEIEGVRYQPIHVVAEAEKDGRNQWLTLTLTEGKNREIRRIFEHFDYPVSRLIRTAYGPFELADLKPGNAREVPHAQVNKLMQSLDVSGE
ncbi:MAG: pseudouridine synthase [Rickettsiales bacterium]